LVPKFVLANYAATSTTSACRLESVSSPNDANEGVAQLRIALRYDQGDGVPVSAKTAFMWYKRPAALGEPESQNQMGDFYEMGLGGAKTGISREAVSGERIAGLAQGESWVRRASARFPLPHLPHRALR